MKARLLLPNFLSANSIVRISIKMPRRCLHVHTKHSYIVSANAIADTFSIHISSYYPESKHSSEVGKDEFLHRARTASFLLALNIPVLGWYNESQMDSLVQSCQTTGEEL